ncbi:threonine-phosphate decarboxylase [Alkaliphilus pronyensis]|uniref:threonine-phosphate decarboxylase n=1 Tax=Alkaliphilus pronyensis TaxID=1482732 RepID=A0A6I0FDX1_9FIRM|nr:threonine-phosphate decarboxylase CobD [Alkaliphilus pronyensis]KAB3532901.1 threonine-phosphate decarboxylase [Alkaliphilus pronyensis]
MIHGGNIYEIEEKMGIPRNDILDFSSNINPLGVPDSLKRIILNSVEDLVKYPDIKYNDLKKAIGQYYSLDKADIIVGNGASEIIFNFIRAINPKRPLIVEPTFNEYRRSLKSKEDAVQNYLLKEKDFFQLKANKLINYMENNKTIDMLVICNPNNPTGGLVEPKEMLDIIQYCRLNKIFLMVDEAFMDFVANEATYTLMEYYKDYDNLMLVRAFTKFYGVPGLRLGFGITSNEKVKRKVEALLPPWNINTFGGYFGEVILSEKKYVLNTREWLSKQQEWFTDKLIAIKDIKVFPTRVNFILIKILTKQLTAKQLQQRLLRKGILIRDCSDFIGLNKQYFRLAIKDKASNERLLSDLTNALK